MAAYKCICCGEIRESEKECSCSNCGYKMFPVPYDRSQVLLGEIREFIRLLRVPKDIEPFLSYYREVPSKSGKEKPLAVPKAKDDERFPDFKKIQSYVCGADKTEKFIARLNESVAQMRKHFHEPFQAAYKMQSQPLSEHAKKLDDVLKKALKELGTDMELTPLTLPEVILVYEERPDEELLFLGDEIFDRLEKLTAKIHRFIKVNNIYGSAYRYKPETPYKLPKQDVRYDRELENVSALLGSTLDKRYSVDIFSDGTEELQEMLKVLWKGAAAVMTVPLLKKTFRFCMPDGAQILGRRVYTVLSEEIQKRYASVDALVLGEEFLAGKSEKELFDLYNKMIETDSLGIMGINKNRLSIPGESERKLQALIGLDSVKIGIQKIKAFALANKGADKLNLHMCFYGNPGTGKTEVARIIAGILHENKILPTDKVIEVDRGGLVGQYVGETPQKTKYQIERAMGGVLFVDEAYALVPKDGGFDYGNEAVATLIKAMEDYRGKFCVILAGYRNLMGEMLASNPGFKSRIQFELDFPNYAREELGQIAEMMLKQREYAASREAMEKMLDVTDVKRKDPNFANAREVRNLLEQVIMCQNLRCGGGDDREIGLADVNRYIQDSHIRLPLSDGAKGSILTAEEELEELIGLSSVKRMVKKIKAYAKRNKQAESFNLHMCFYGNPGTGKTEVARILSRILYEAGVLAEAKLVETDAHGLIGKYVGETAPKTQGKVQEAMGGVLFIDEAYGLCPQAGSDGVPKSYGDEAIAVLLKDMEDYRGQFCTIFAGYEKEMQAMLGSNPGLKSRIQFTMEFPDYTREELGEIASLFLGKKGYEIEEKALEKLLDVTEYYRRKPDFANARTVRNILDQVVMNQNLRTEEEEAPDSQILLSDVEDYIADEKIDLGYTGGGTRRIGFA